MIMPLFCCIFFSQANICYAEELCLAEPHLNQYKFFTYLIYNDEVNNESKIMYSEYKFGKIVDFGREVMLISRFLSKGTYIMSCAYAYNAYEFELESTFDENRQKFHFNLDEGKSYYFLISLDDKGKPTATLINENEGIKLLKKMKHVVD